MPLRVRSFCAGLVVGLFVGGGAWAAAHSLRAVASPSVSTSAKAPAPAESTRIVLENDRVRVREVIFPTNVANPPMHTHELAHVGVILTKGALVFTEPGGQPERVAFEPGSVGYREANATHSVANPGPEPMRVLEVELK